MQKSSKRLAKISLLILIIIFVCLIYDGFAVSGNIYDQIQKFMEVIQKIKQLYVEDIDADVLVEGAIRGMLEELDPHSVYIPKKRMQELTEQFEGEFEGIGIEFIIHKKIPTLMSPIAGSPSEKIGLHAGDQIISIEGKSTYGLTELEVRDQLLGPKGTRVTIEIQRPGLEEPFEVTITRDVIPVYSITVSFMLDDSTGFIRVGRFSKTTKNEFEKALAELESSGMKRLLLDLRGNAGGYLEQAVEMVDKFVKGKKRIVYTIGRIPNSNEDYYSSTDSSDLSIPLIVLIDHGSASAAEIVAGAIQDWDRGLIVGNTSFGKGLVQRQDILKDGSAVRITIAKYYTPSGRLIQRSYKGGIRDYIAQGWDEIDPNANDDSTLNKPVFTTNSGRKVYGGGGISPDIVLKSKPLSIPTIQFIQNQLFFEFGSYYAKKHNKLGRNFQDFKSEFIVDNIIINEFIEFAKSKKLKFDEIKIKNDSTFIKRRIKSQIARHLWSAREYNQIEVIENEQVKEARRLFMQAVEMARLNDEEN